jgi:hypothetical protein
VGEEVDVIELGYWPAPSEQFVIPLHQLADVVIDLQFQGREQPRQNVVQADREDQIQQLLLVEVAG